RLARELHDTLAHTLSGLAVNLEAIKIILGGDQHEVRGMLDHALHNTRYGLTETRRALKDLRAKQLEELGLGIAIRNLAHDAASRAGFTLKLNISGSLADLTPDVEQCYYRIAQESLQNIVKHARAKYASIKLVEDKGALIMVIADDGVGFNFANFADMNLEEELGLKGMRERASMVGADLEVSSQPEGGTTIQLSMELAYGQGFDM
ncbi:MAG: sensor histidine kinase, partial [Chloroflexi bacterium]|nr:sensor histidine kinase [Chloroflexota bacterium]